MRRWNLLVLVALLPAVLLIAPSRAMAATPSTTSFKGKAAWYTKAGPYFVVSFTCSPPAPTSPPGTLGTLTGNWTYDYITQSVSGPLGPSGCSLSPSNNGWSNTGTMGNIPIQVGTLSVVLSDIVATKTYIPPKDETCPSPTSNPYPCIAITLSNPVGVPPFDSLNSQIDTGYGTLNLTLPKT
jgi:hypothetical protein